MLSYTNKLLQHILEVVEVSPDCLFRESEVRQISADDFNLLFKEKFLAFHRYNPEGSNFPCQDQTICGETCDRIIREIKGRFEAVCPDSSSAPIVLSQEDINKYHFDIKAFAEVIRSDNKLNGSYEELDGRLYFIGTKETDKQSMAFMLALLNNPKTAESLLLTLPHKLSRYPAKVILLPFFNQLSQQALRTLEAGNIYLYDFSKAFTDNNWVINPKILSSVIAKLKPLTETVAKFPTPDGTTWDNTTIDFIAEGEVKISMPGLRHPYAKHFSVMDFQDTRRTLRGVEPDMAWRVFRLIAQNQGEWTLGTLLKDAKIFRKKKGFDPAAAELSAAAQTEEYLRQFTGIKIEGIQVSDIPTYVGMLRTRLKEYFGIDDDPFHLYYARGKKPGYQAKFRVFCSYKESALDENSPS